MMSTRMDLKYLILPVNLLCNHKSLPQGSAGQCLFFLAIYAQYQLSRACKLEMSKGC